MSPARSDAELAEFFKTSDFNDHLKRLPNQRKLAETNEALSGVFPSDHDEVVKTLSQTVSEIKKQRTLKHLEFLRVTPPQSRSVNSIKSESFIVPNQDVDVQCGSLTSPIQDAAVLPASLSSSPLKDMPPPIPDRGYSVDLVPREPLPGTLNSHSAIRIDPSNRISPAMADALPLLSIRDPVTHPRDVLRLLESTALRDVPSVPHPPPRPVRPEGIADKRELVEFHRDEMRRQQRSTQLRIQCLLRDNEALKTQNNEENRQYVRQIEELELQLGDRRSSSSALAERRVTQMEFSLHELSAKVADSDSRCRTAKQLADRWEAEIKETSAEMLILRERLKVQTTLSEGLKKSRNELGRKLEQKEIEISRLRDAARLDSETIRTARYAVDVKSRDASDLLEQITTLRSELRLAESGCRQTQIEVRDSGPCLSCNASSRLTTSLQRQNAELISQLHSTCDPPPQENIHEVKRASRPRLILSGLPSSSPVWNDAPRKRRIARHGL